MYSFESSFRPAVSENWMWVIGQGSSFSMHHIVSLSNPAGPGFPQILYPALHSPKVKEIRSNCWFKISNRIPLLTLTSLVDPWRTFWENDENQRCIIMKIRDWTSRYCSFKLNLYQKFQNRRTNFINHLIKTQISPGYRNMPHSLTWNCQTNALTFQLYLTKSFWILNWENYGDWWNDNLSLLSRW